MKILQINNCHYRRGGADAVYLNTAELLSRMGDEVVFFSTSSKENVDTEKSEYFVQKIDFLELSTINKILITPRYLYSKEAGHKLQELLDVEKPDIAHIHLYKGDLTASILKVLKSNKVPVVSLYMIIACYAHVIYCLTEIIRFAKDVLPKRH